MQKVIDALSKGNNFLILGHENPDGDAIGSVCALSKFLTLNGHKVTTLFVDEIANKYKKIIPVEFKREISLEEVNQFDYIIMLDSSTRERVNLPVNVNFTDINVPIINIDHHMCNKIDGSINFVITDAAACAEIVAMLVKEMEEQLKYVVNQEVAEMLYLGMVTDTGSFRFTNTRAKTFEMTSYVVSKGANLSKIIDAAFFSKPLKQLEFEADMINNNMKSAFDNRFLYSIITQDLLDKHQFNMRDGEGVIEYLREIETTVIAALIYPRKNGLKVSLRSKQQQYSVGEIARKLGGGGHEMAAGVSFEDKSYFEVEEILLKEIGAKLNNEI